MGNSIHNNYFENTGVAKISFFQAIGSFFKNIVNFNGRASRREYFFIFIFQYFLFIPFGIFFAFNLVSSLEFNLGLLLNAASLGSLGLLLNGPGILLKFILEKFIFIFIIFLLLGIANFSLYVRRLHDSERSGWWLLLWFTAIGSPLLLIILFCFKKENTINLYKNRYGIDPEITQEGYEKYEEEQANFHQLINNTLLHQAISSSNQKENFEANKARYQSNRI